MESSKLSFCIIIPMLNEEVNAEGCVRAVMQVLEGLSYRTALIVVNDGSSDDTGNILKKLGGEFRYLITVTHECNRGYGSAIQTGIKEANSLGFRYALFMDSDLTNDPKYIKDFVIKMEEGIDVIKGSRYIKGGGMLGIPKHRMIISFFGNRVASWLMGIPLFDCTNGFRAVKVNILDQMPLTERGFPIIMEELYHTKYLAKTYCEIPYILTSRQKGEGKSKFTYRPEVFWEYFKYILKAAFGSRPHYLK